MFRLIIGSLLILSPAFAHAGNTTGTIDEVYVLGFKDAVIFSMESSSQNFDGCATTLRYAIDTSTDQGRIIFSAILAAKASGQKIKAHGKANNLCAIHGDAEDINYIVIQ